MESQHPPWNANRACRPNDSSSNGAATDSGSGSGGAGGGLLWLSPDERTSEPFSPAPADAWALADAYDMCLTGDALSALQELGAAETYIPLTQVRVVGGEGAAPLSSSLSVSHHSPLSSQLLPCSCMNTTLMDIVTTGYEYGRHIAAVVVTLHGRPEAALLKGALAWPRPTLTPAHRPWNKFKIYSILVRSTEI